MNKLITLLFFVCFVVSLAQRWHLPPPKVLINNHFDCVKDKNITDDPNFNCKGGLFTLTTGFYIPCRAHMNCYGAREPPKWCSTVRQFNWTQWGCHCDLKIGSCVVERKMTEKTLEWAYCIPNDEFFCANGN